VNSFEVGYGQGLPLPWLVNSFEVGYGQGLPLPWLAYMPSSNRAV